MNDGGIPSSLSFTRRAVTRATACRLSPLLSESVIHHQPPRSSGNVCHVCLLSAPQFNQFKAVFRHSSASRTLYSFVCPTSELVGVNVLGETLCHVQKRGLQVSRTRLLDSCVHVMTTSSLRRCQTAALREALCQQRCEICLPPVSIFRSGSGC